MQELKTQEKNFFFALSIRSQITIECKSLGSYFEGLLGPAAYLPNSLWFSLRL